ncbi:MAG: cytochrome C oxidase subunit IV family protein [Acidobacteriota bacterium]
MKSDVHVEPVLLYLGVFGALLVLTGVTIGAASVDLGPFNTLVALAIASTKAALVILFFMHVRHATRLTKLVVAGAFLWLFILLALTMGDYLTR